MNLILYLDKGYSFVAEKDGEIFYSSKREGLFPLVECLSKFPSEFEGCNVADKIVGIAAARLFIRGKVKSVICNVASEDAVKFLENNLKFNPNKIIKNILNKDETDICPMEKLSEKFDDVEEFFEELKRLNNL